MTTQLAAKRQPALPPILAGNASPDMRKRVGDFFFSAASLFEAWVTRRKSAHTQRAYREDVMSFVKFAGIDWPDQATALFSVSVKDVLAFREQLVERNAAPKTINRRISSVSSFFKYLAAAAAEMRLPITVPNPAHAQFISRESTDPREETRALSATRARQLIGLPDGESVTDYRESHFMYEADRGSENTTRFKMKLRAHWHFIVKQNRHRVAAPYMVHAIRAVLTESTTSQWAHNLRLAAKEPVVSPRPSPLFWFTTSELLTKPTPVGKTTVPLYLAQPEVMFKRIWASPAEDIFLNLAD